MDQVHVIRYQVLREGRSQRWVARRHGVSRNTVRKYLDQSAPRRVESKPRRRWVTERMAPRLEELLSRWSRRTTAKQRLTATRLHRQLLEDGYEVGITTVRSYVREWKRQRQETFIPLVHRAGECGQVDFFEVTVEEDGVAHRVWKFLLHLPYSGRSFVWLYDRCDQVAFLDGHVRAFAHFGGVPLRLVYDNLSAAVRRRVGGERQLTARFQALVSHYLFEPCFARPRRGARQGQRGVARQGNPSGAHESGASRAHSGGDRTGVLASVDAAHGNRARWQEERAALRELPPTAFEARKLEIVRASRQATVQLGGATYSVPSRWKSLDIHALVGAREITFTCRDEAYCRDRMRPGQRLVRYAHYFEELSRKPQAVRQVAPPPLLRKPWPPAASTCWDLSSGALRPGWRCPRRSGATRSRAPEPPTSTCCFRRRHREPGRAQSRHQGGPQDAQDAFRAARLRAGGPLPRPQDARADRLRGAAGRLRTEAARAGLLRLHRPATMSSWSDPSAPARRISRSRWASRSPSAATGSGSARPPTSSAISSKPATSGNWAASSSGS